MKEMECKQIELYINLCINLYHRVTVPEMDTVQVMNICKFEYKNIIFERRIKICTHRALIIELFSVYTCNYTNCKPLVQNDVI